MKIQKSYHFVHVSLLLYEQYEKGWLFERIAVVCWMDGLECEFDGRVGRLLLKGRYESLNIQYSNMYVILRGVKTLTKYDL